MNNYIVAIVGRPNVGKSTLFNRLIGSRKAIEDDISGVTRDRLYGEAEWQGKEFSLVDTGGYVPSSEDVFESAIREQVEIAIKEASAIILLVDVTCSITHLDERMAEMLRKISKPVYLVVNKVDNNTRHLEANEFYRLGFKKNFFISSINGSGTGELLDEITSQIPDESEEENEKEIPKIAILGRPNVGKSSLLNALLGQTRNIVTDIAGTTRDAIHTHYNMFNQEVLLIDTAGIRKKTNVKENLEFYSVIRAIRIIDEADICLLMIDAQSGMESQDINILRIILKKKKGLIILVNKWDIVEAKQANTIKEYEAEIRAKTAPFTDYPIIFISALTKQRIYKAIETAIQVYENRKIKIQTSKLNDILLKAIEKHPHPIVKRKTVKIKYITQLAASCPTFAFYCNNPEIVKPDYKQYIENILREKFNLEGVPINIFFRSK